jgi:hypothetical protein
VRVAQAPDGAAPFEVAARTDFEGRFRAEGLVAGRAELVARRPGVLVGASDAVTVRPGAPATADLVLREEGVLAGRVRAGGDGGATVVAVAMSGGPGTFQAARIPVDRSGEYRALLPAGDYRVHAARGGAAADDRRPPAFARVEPGRTSRLDLAPGEAAPGAGVQVLVREPGGAPSAGALVTVARAGDARVAFAARAGADGRAAIPAEAGIAGRVTIRARNAGRAGAETLDLPAAGSVSVTLAPAPAR